MRKATLLLATLMAFCSCDQVGSLSDLSQEQQEQLAAINFKFNIDAWGTERQLESGDRFGLFAGTPINVNNVLMTYESDGTFKCAQEVKWNLDSKTTSITFAAYAPYSASYSSGVGTFQVQSDQTTPDAVKASDLMTASIKLSSRQNLITLDFSHKMARLSFYFDNRSGYDIESVTVLDVCQKASFNLTKGEVSTTTFTSSSIKAGKYMSSSSKTYYSVLIAPQSAKPRIKVSLSGGKAKTFILDNSTSFTSGKLWDNESTPLVIQDVKDEGEEEDIPATFSLQIKDWNDGGSMYFVKQ